jgi:WD40 repeat protein
MRLRALLISCVMVLCFQPAFSQCQAPILSTSSKFNLLTPELEFELGELNAQQQATNYRLLEVGPLKHHLQEIGKRLEEHLPPNEIKFRYFIVDEGEANAWALPGGRIYVTRKLISYVKNEDELAAVMAHEMGHELVHHGAVRWSRIIKDSFDINSIRNRVELEDAFNRLMDLYKRKGVFRDDDGEKEQLQADQVAVYGMAAAGYDPKAAVEFWNRFADVRGKKSNWFLDAMDSSTSESKRLRSFSNTAAGVPANCVDKKRASDTNSFQAWQSAVRTYSGPGQSELLHNVAFKKQLQPPLRSEINHLQFSPDGKYILAQDETSIFVLTREPFKAVMRIDAEDSYPAQFSMDSKHLSFYTEGLRVERWSVESHELEDVGEVHAVHGCIQSKLSADGKYMACLELSTNPEMPLPLQLAVFDTSTNEVIYRKKDFLGSQDRDDQYAWLLYVIRNEADLVNLGFSPDSRYLLAGRGNSPLEVDLSIKKEISMPGSIKKLVGMSFAFLGPERLVGVDGERGEKSAEVKFPSGETVISELPIGPLWISPPGHGDYVIARPLPKAPVGIMDLQKKQFTIGNKTDAIDIYDGTYVSERTSGELALYKYPLPSPVATVQLPNGPIGTIHAFALSPDLKYLALSERKRGSIWDLQTGNREMYLRGFRGVEFDDTSIIMDFPSADDYIPPLLKRQKQRDVEKNRGEQPGHSIVLMAMGGSQPVERDKFLRKNQVRMSGPYVIVLNPDKPEDYNRKEATMEIRDGHTGVKLWTKRFDKQVPGMNYRRDSDSLILMWDLSDSAVKDEVKGDAEAKQRLDSLKEDFEGSYFVEVLDFRTGKAIAKFPVDSGKASFKLNAAYVYGDHVFLQDSFDRVLVYSLKGQLLSRHYGTFRAASKDGKILVLSVGRGRMNRYKIGTREPMDQLIFESRVSHVEFTPDSKKLVVMTRDQTLYGFDLEGLQTAQR